MISSAGCNLFKAKEKIVYVDNYCTLDAVIDSTAKDKEALKKAVLTLGLSKEFVTKIRNHNDLWRNTCSVQVKADNDLTAKLVTSNNPK